MNDWATQNPERVQSCMDEMKRMTPEEVAKYVVHVEYERALLRNQADWLDGLAMLLRGQPDRYKEDEDGYETDETMDEGELEERYEQEEKRLKELFYPAKLQKS